ncbi:MAG: hypothetical protein PHG04_00240, partial [Candidatus Nanoarchaeia archaeon]|nr:hypothetical protein [Candidatus Nanoarchaeia archaeon]
PSEAVVQSHYDFLFQQGKVGSARQLMEWSKIQPSEAVVQSHHDSLIKQGKVGSAKALMEWSKVQLKK